LLTDLATTVSRPRNNTVFKNNNKCTTIFKPKHGNRGYQTTPALCTPPPRLQPICRIACSQKVSKYYLHLPGILNYPASAAWHYWRLNDPCCSERVSDAAVTAAANILIAGTTPENCPFRLGICTSIKYMVRCPPPESSSETDRFSRLRMGPKCYAVQCIVNGVETPKVPLPLGIASVTPPEEDRAMAIGNMHDNW